MVILLLFNGADSLTYTEISEATAIPVADLKRALQSLACAKFKLLIKEPKGREIDESDSFSYNADFSAKQMRFKVRVRLRCDDGLMSMSSRRDHHAITV